MYCNLATLKYLGLANVPLTIKERRKSDENL